MKRLAIVFVLLLAIAISACSRYDEGAEEPGEALVAAHWFERLADGEHTDGCPAGATGGETVILRQELSHATPYEHAEIVFDPAMLKAVELAKNTGLSEDSTYEWQFMPLASGETEVMRITRYLTDDILECLILHITIDDDLVCAVDWYETGVIGENYVLISD